MKRLARVATRLYPRAWRRRYGREFDVLLDDVDIGWTDLAGILFEATAMQLKVHGLTLAGWTVAGALVGVAISLCIPPRYDSSAIVRLSLTDADTQSTSADRWANLDAVFFAALSDASMEALGRSEGLIGASDSARTRREALDTLRRSTFVQLFTVDAATRVLTLKISFIDTDRDRSQRVNQKVLSLLSAASAALSPSVVAAPLQIVSGPTHATASRRRQVLAAIGTTALGLLSGFVVLFTRRST
jgi:hypothetical protein